VNAVKTLALLVPGLDGTGGLFYRQIPALSERYRVRAWRFRERTDFDLEDLASELLEATVGEEPGSVTLIAESFGGPIALCFALAYPGILRRLVLVNAFPHYGRKVRIRVACLLAPLLRKPVVRDVKDFIVDRVLISEGIEEDDRRQYDSVVAGVYQPAYCRRLTLIRQLDLRPRLHEIHVPTLLFASGRDKVVPSVREGRAMASRIPDAKLFEFPNAGHALLLTPEFSLADYL
jgi:pimeloyl-ACP methyl ester carboxylesterase